MTMMNKLSTTQAGQMMKLAAENLRSLSVENSTLRQERDEAMQKVAAFEQDKRIERVAKAMEAKGLNPELSLEEKVASLRSHEKLEVLEEAVNLSAPQMKLASVAGDETVNVEGAGDSEAATNNFAAALASLED
jgi:secreted Zn-dependent insulinase-like peptidase